LFTKRFVISSEPDKDLVPDQSSEAVQLSVFVEVQDKLISSPSVIVVVLGVKVSVGALTESIDLI